MVAKAVAPLAALYVDDETAWLERMAELAAARQVEDMDFENLSEFLRSMAIRDRREVTNRLRVVLTHLLKWDHQETKRSRSWEATIKEQRKRLALLLETETLKQHAIAILPKAYAAAVELAATETGLNPAAFPKKCPYSLDSLSG